MSGHIVVIGDSFVDRYVYGTANRLSPEAPIPVLEVSSVGDSPGGAANTAVAVNRLGAEVRLVTTEGVGGPDSGALCDALTDSRTNPKWVVRAPEKYPQVKTRFMCSNSGYHQLLRVDREDRRPYSPETERKITETYREAVAGAKFVIVSDYAKGLITGDLMEVVWREASRAQIPVLVDPKPANYALYRGRASIIAPNREELRQYVQRPSLRPADAVAAAGEMCLSLCSRSARPVGILAKLDRHGACWVDGRPLMGGTDAGLDNSYACPTKTQYVTDVTGAGDVAVAAFAVEFVRTQDPVTATKFAMLAAGVAVATPGTYCPYRHEIDEEGN